MSLASLVSWLKQTRSSRQPGGSRRRYPTPKFRPWLEELETRAVPATLTVLNNLDQGMGSLRDTIALAANGDTIVFANSLDDKTIALTSGQLSITKDLTIVGLGADDLTISGRNASRIFSVAAGATVSISNLSLTRGLASTGGAIDNAGNLTLSNTVLTSNRSVGGQGGGDILNQDGASLLLTRSILADNRAITSVGSDVFGGGLLNFGVATVSATAFTNNRAEGGGSGTFFGGSVGGAIANRGAVLTVDQSSFVGNQAISAAGPFFVTGGAIENDSGDNLDDPSTATITRSVFIGNSATGGDGVTANGGGIDNQGFLTFMTIRDSLISGNLSRGGDRPDGMSTFGEGLGGGVMNLFGEMTIDNCVISYNVARGGDQGSATELANPPTGSGQGGGVVNLGGTMFLSNSTLRGNLARGGISSVGVGGIATGGGLDNYGNGLGVPDGIVEVRDCLVVGNQAIAGRSGAGFVAPFAFGGGLDTAFNGIMTVIDTRILGNSVIGGRGEVGGNGIGGGIGVGFGFLLGLEDASTAEITDSSLIGNVAQGGRGIDVGGDGQGGGLGIATGSSATLSNSTVKFNLAVGGEANRGGTRGQGVGGGVFSDGTFAFDVLSVIRKNRASTSNDNIFP